jgi:hypothetical protein
MRASQIFSWRCLVAPEPSPVRTIESPLISPQVSHAVVGKMNLTGIRTEALVLLT